MSSEAVDGFAALDLPWRTAFEEAWRSWQGGNFGIGAVLTDPNIGGEPIVAVGRNLVATGRPADQPLAGNYMAHAEMNAFASLDRYNAGGLRLTTTLEPCLMCGATAIFLNVADIRFAVRDEYFESLDENLWPHHPYTRDRQPSSVQGLGGELSLFARLLPLAHTMRTIPDSKPAKHARSVLPELAALAESVMVQELQADAANGLTLADGLAGVWANLATLSR